MDIYEKTKQRHEAMSFEEKKQEKINFTRQLRNMKLEASDKYMSQSDRYSINQLEQLKLYRQALRDLMNIEDFNNLDKSIDFPIEPSFIIPNNINIDSLIKNVV